MVATLVASAAGTRRDALQIANGQVSAALEEVTQMQLALSTAKESKAKFTAVMEQKWAEIQRLFATDKVKELSVLAAEIKAAGADVEKLEPLIAKLKDLPAGAQLSVILETAGMESAVAYTGCGTGQFSRAIRYFFTSMETESFYANRSLTQSVAQTPEKVPSNKGSASLVIFRKNSAFHNSDPLESNQRILDWLCLYESIFVVTKSADETSFAEKVLREINPIMGGEVVPQISEYMRAAVECHKLSSSIGSLQENLDKASRKLNSLRDKYRKQVDARVAAAYLFG